MQSTLPVGMRSRGSTNSPLDTANSGVGVDLAPGAEPEGPSGSAAVAGAERKPACLEVRKEIAATLRGRESILLPIGHRLEFRAHGVSNDAGLVGSAELPHGVARLGIGPGTAHEPAISVRWSRFVGQLDGRAKVYSG